MVPYGRMSGRWGPVTRSCDIWHDAAQASLPVVLETPQSGATQMKLLLMIVCWGWIILGVWWFFRPASIRRRFEKRFRKSARWLLLTAFVVVAGLVFAGSRQIGGVIGVILAIVGCIALLKGLLLLHGRVSDRVLDTWSRQPDAVYRLAAADLFLLGCLVKWVLSFGA